MTNVLEVGNLSAGYGKTQVLFNISLSIRSGEIVGIFGRNGVGKTTLLRAITKLIPSTSDIHRIFQSNVSTKDTAALAAAGLSLVPQDRGIFPNLTVNENLEIGAYAIRNHKTLVSALQAIHELFPILHDRAQQKATLLSGGEQQMLAIGRALISRPKLLILDEPSFGLAPNVVDKILEIVKTWRATSNTSLIIVEQNLQLALSLCDTAIVLAEGKVAYTGSPTVLNERTDVASMYLN